MDSLNVESSELYRSCQLGDKTTVINLLKAETKKPEKSLRPHVQVTVRDFSYVDRRNGDTPLHWVCKHGWLDVLKILVEEEGYREEYLWAVDKYSTLRKTPMHFAIEHGHSDMVLYLISKYTCIEIVGRLLEHSQLSKRTNRDVLIEVIQLSIKHGVWHPNETNSEGNTLLHVACKANRPDIIEYLVSGAKCDPNSKNNDGKTPAQLTFSYIKKAVNYSETIGANSEGFLGLMSTLVSLTNCDELQCIELLKHSLKYCDSTWRPDDKTINGNTALHLACKANKHEIVKFLLGEAQCNPNVENSDGKTPVHLTLHFSIIHELVDHGAIVNAELVSNLMISFIEQSMKAESIIALLRIALNKHTWNTNEKLPPQGDTLLHLACMFYQWHFAAFFLSEAKCDPNIRNCAGKTPIQLIWETRDPHELAASFKGFEILINHGAISDSGVVSRLIDAAKQFYLLHNAQCWPKENIFKAIELFKLSLKNCTWNPNDKINDKGDTVLHSASIIVEPCEIIHYLLSEANCNPNIKNNEGLVPLDIVCESVASSPEVIQDFVRHGAKAKNISMMCIPNRYPKLLNLNKSFQSLVKLFIVGNPCVGKSTLTAALKKELSFIDKLLTSKKVTDVDERTAGIIPHDFNSKKYGPVTIYDFAGHRVFYSSHAALLQSAVQSSPPLFILVVNLCDSDEEIKQNILYWYSFLDNLCTSVIRKPHVIVVGSHADKLKTDPDMKLCVLDTQLFGNLEYIGFVAMDCQYCESSGISTLRQMIMESCRSLRTQDEISFNAHCFYVFIMDQFKELNAIKLSIIQAHIKNQQRVMNKAEIVYFLPQNIEALCRICSELNDRGHILLLKDKNKVGDSWVIIDKPVLLSEITGTVFAPGGFRQHVSLASNTGVVPFSVLMINFPDYDPKMVVDFLTHLEFCNEICDEKVYKLISDQHSQSPNEHYYLFPALIKLSIPDNMWESKMCYAYNCGWILQSTVSHEFFSSRFIQVLLLRLAFSFALNVSSEEVVEQHLGIHRKCSLWKNGIFWGNRFGVEILVEVLPNNKAVVVLMRLMNSAYTTEAVNLRSGVISTVLQCAQQFCPQLDITDSLINSVESQNYPLISLSDLTHFTIQDVAKATIETSHEQPVYVVSSTGATTPFYDLIMFEPYAELSKSTIQSLCIEENSEKVVSDHFLVNICCQVSESKNTSMLIKILSEKQPTTVEGSDLLHDLHRWRDRYEGTYKCLRDKLDQFSVFGGRNILELAGYHDVDLLMIGHPEGIPHNGSKVYALDITPKFHELYHLEAIDGKTVRVIEEVSAKWKDVAIALRFDIHKLNNLESDAQHVSECACREMFIKWLDKREDLRRPITWATLIQSLKDAQLVKTAEKLKYVCLNLNHMSESMFTPLNTSIPAGQPNTQRTADKVVVVPVNCMHSGDRPCNPANIKSGRSPRLCENTDDQLKRKTLQRRDCCLSMDVLEMFESRGGRKIKVIDDVASQWDELAKALGFGDEDIDRIKCTFPNSYEACREMLAKWLEGDESLIGPVIWTTLIQSLINAGLVDVADNIREGLNFAEKDDKELIDSITSTSKLNVESGSVKKLDGDFEMIINELRPLASDWKSIGVLLDIDSDELDKIEGDQRRAVMDCLQEMLLKWLKQVDPTSIWAEIIDAVEQINEEKAKDMREKWM